MTHARNRDKKGSGAVFAKTDYAREMKITSAQALLDACRAPGAVEIAIPEGWTLQLPRVYLHQERELWQTEAAAKSHWAAQCWWRSEQDGHVGYYARVNLRNGMLMELRELAPGAATFPEERPEAAAAYLDACVQALSDSSAGWQESQQLQQLWEAAAAEDLKNLSREKEQEPGFQDYYLPREILEYWNWEKLKTLLLQRYKTTEEDILDYAEYKYSDSKLRYVPLRYREECRAKGIRFWGDGNDG